MATTVRTRANATSLLRIDPARPESRAVSRGDTQIRKPVIGSSDRQVESAQRADLGVAIVGQACSGVLSVSGVFARPHIGHTWPRFTRHSSRTAQLSTVVCTGAHARCRQMATRRPHDEIDAGRLLASYHNMIHACRSKTGVENRGRVAVDVADRRL
jgi:hypothetical protein